MENIIEGVKELIRIVLLAIIPVAYLSLEAKSVDWRTISLIAVIAGLRGIEKWLHERDSKIQLPI